MVVNEGMVFSSPANYRKEKSRICSEHDATYPLVSSASIFLLASVGNIIHTSNRLVEQSVPSEYNLNAAEFGFKLRAVSDGTK